MIILSFFMFVSPIDNIIYAEKSEDWLWYIWLIYRSKWDKMLHHFVKCLFSAFPLRRPFGKSAFPFPSFSAVSSFWKLLPRPYGSRFPLFLTISSFAMVVHWEFFFCQKNWRRHFWIPILSGHHTFSHICNHICNKNLQYNFPKMRGGSKAVWNFSENSSDFVARPFPYCPTALSKNTGCPRKKSTLKWWWWYH